MRHKNSSWLNETRDQKNRCNDKCQFCMKVMYFLDLNVLNNDRIYVFMNIVCLILAQK